MRGIEIFYQNLRHDDSIEEQIQQSGIIQSYMLTTLSFLNARRETDLCLWCDATWSVEHRCAYAPVYNCRFTFGEDDDGMAFVLVSKEGLKHVEVKPFGDKTVTTNAHNMFDEMLVSDSCVSHKNEVEYAASQVVYEGGDSISNSNDSQGVDPSFNVGESLRTAIGDAHESFDKLPVPDFMLEMALATENTQPNEEVTCTQNLLNEISKPISSLKQAQEVDIEHGDTQICEHTGTRIIEVTSFEQNFGLVNKSGDIVDRNLLTDNRLMTTSKVFSFLNLDDLYSISCKRHLVCDCPMLRLTFGGLYYALCTTTELINESLQTKLFDPGINVIKIVNWPNATLEDKGDFRGREEKVLVKNACKLCDVVISLTMCLYGLTNMKLVFFVYIFDPGGLHCQCDYLDFRCPFDSKGLGSDNSRMVLLLGTVLEEGWSIIRGASLIFGVADCMTIVSSIVEVYLSATVARLCIALCVFGSSLLVSSLRQNQTHSRDFNLLEQPQDPRFCALPHESQQAAAFAESVNEFVCCLDAMLVQGCHLEALIALSCLNFLIGKEWSTKRVLYKMAKFLMVLKWRPHLLVGYGHIYNDTIFVFDPGGLFSYLQLFVFDHDGLLAYCDSFDFSS